MIVFHIVLLIAALLALAWRPRSLAAVAFAGAAAVADLALGAGSLHVARRAVEQTAPLGLFLTAAIWLAVLAARSGLAERAAMLLERWADGRKMRLYVLTCVACAALTATVSLDGAVVLMGPLVVALARNSRELMRPLLLGTVAVANAFSLAVPQGNPTNLVIMERVDLSPRQFIAALLGPALLATVVCIVALAAAERAALRGRYPSSRRRSGPFSAEEKLAAAALAAAALAGSVAPWIGVPPWWALCAVAAIAYAGAHAALRAVPAPQVPWRVCVQVGALLVLVDALATPAHAPLLTAASPVALVAVSLGAAVAASAANNLPASVAFAGLHGPRSLPAYAALTGLSVGALATPHGSIATTIAFDRAGPELTALGSRRYVSLLAPAALVATIGATVALWLLAG